MTETPKTRKPRKMLTKPVEQAFRQDMNAALAANVFALNADANQTDDDLIALVKAGIKDGTYQPGITFAEFYEALGGDPSTLPGGKVEDAPPAEEQAQGAIAAAQAEVSEPIDDLAGWLGVIAKANAKISEAEEIKDRAKSVIQARLGDKTQATVNGQVVATYDWVKATKFDKDKLKAEHPELVEQYTVPNPHRRFVLK